MGRAFNGGGMVFCNSLFHELNQNNHRWIYWKTYVLHTSVMILINLIWWVKILLKYFFVLWSLYLRTTCPAICRYLQCFNSAYDWLNKSLVIINCAEVSYWYNEYLWIFKLLPGNVVAVTIVVFVAAALVVVAVVAASVVVVVFVG